MFAKFLAALLVISSVAAGAQESEPQNYGIFSQKLMAGVREGSEEDISELIDQAMATVRSIVDSIGLERVPLPNATIEFRETIVGIEFYGVVGLYNGFLSGINTLHRTGDAKFIIETNGDILAQVELGVIDIALEYSLVLEFMGIGPRATVIGELSQVSIDMVIRIATDSTIRLERLVVNDSGFLRVSVKGLGIILNFVADFLANILGNLAKNTVVELIQGPIVAIINAILEGLVPETSAFQDVLAQASSFVGNGGQPIHHFVKL